MIICVIIILFYNSMLQGALCGALLNALCINPQLIRYCVQHSVFNIYSKHTFLQIFICHAQVSASSPRICRPRGKAIESADRQPGARHIRPHRQHHPPNLVAAEMMKYGKSTAAKVRRAAVVRPEIRHPGTVDSGGGKRRIHQRLDLIGRRPCHDLPQFSLALQRH